jgi:CO/xanthine dehydrogenase Mo-binding subunit
MHPLRFEWTEFAAGQVKDTNFDSYTPPSIGDVPELDIEFIESAEVPVGLGELGTTVVAPAIGNAIFAEVGGPDTRLAHPPDKRIGGYVQIAHSLCLQPVT